MLGLSPFPFALFVLLLATIAVYAQADPSITDDGYFSKKYDICKDDIGACSGLITGIIALVAACLLLFWWYRRRKTTKAETQKSDLEQNKRADEERIERKVRDQVAMEHSKRLGDLLVPPELRAK